MKLTQEQFIKIVNHIQKIAPEGLKCPVCGATEWSINDTIFQAVEFTGTRMQIGQGMAIMPFVVLNCTNCKHCLEFNAIHLGIIEGEKKTQETKEPNVNSK